MSSDTAPVDVVVIGPSHLDSFASNIADGFSDLGISNVVLDPYARFAGQGTARAYGRFGTAMRRVVDRSSLAAATLVGRPIGESLRKLRPRLVLNVFAYFPPQQIEDWRRDTPDAVWALWYPDHLGNLGAHGALLAPYDRLFFKERHLATLFAERSGLPASYLPDACNPRHHKSVPGIAEGRLASDVVMVGNLYPYRMLILDAIDPGIDLRIYGNLRRGLPERFSRLTLAHTGRIVFGPEKARVFRESRIVLNTMHFGEVDGINTRVFEASACGAFVLSHSNSALSRYFEPEVEVATFDSIVSLNATIERYLADPERRAAIAAAGSQRAHRDHTYSVRLRRLLSTCGVGDDVLPSPERAGEVTQLS